MNVGGNSDSIANSIVCPATVAPFTEIVKRLLIDAGVEVGWKLNVICFHPGLEVKAAVLVMSWVPVDVCRPTLNVPEIAVAGGVGKR